jgi:hypothetical protein
MQFGWKHYWAPTPVRVRKVADGIASAAVFAGTLTSMNGDTKAGTVIFITGFLAKVISNFFRNDYKRVKKG